MATLDKEIEILMLKGESGGTIDRLEKTATVGNVDTYTIYMSDGATYTFQVTNGTSIQNIAKTSTSGLVDTYTITLTDGSTFTFQVTNGQDGEVTQAQLNALEDDIYSKMNIAKRLIIDTTNNKAYITKKGLYAVEIKTNNSITERVTVLLSVSNLSPTVSLPTENNPTPTAYYNISTSGTTRELYVLTELTTQLQIVHCITTATSGDKITNVYLISEYVNITNPTYQITEIMTATAYQLDVTNPNSKNATLYWRVGDGSYNNTSINANETLQIMITSPAYSTGDIYLEINENVSDVVSFTIPIQ